MRRNIEPSIFNKSPAESQPRRYVSYYRAIVNYKVL